MRVGLAYDLKKDVPLGQCQPEDALEEYDSLETVSRIAAVLESIGHRVEWHFIGRLQKNKVKKAVTIFDMIETVDSLEIAAEIDRRCTQSGRVMPVLIEVNSGAEEQKTGVLPGDVEALIRETSALPNIRVMGLMTMGPRTGDPEQSRPYFAETRRVFERIKALNLPGVEMKYLAMGMSNTYRVAIEEGATMIRVGTAIFGERNNQ